VVRVPGAIWELSFDHYGGKTSTFHKLHSLTLVFLSLCCELPEKRSGARPSPSPYKLV